MQLIDSHCHIDDPRYSTEIDALLQRAQSAGVDTVIDVGIDINSSRRAVQLAEQYPSVYATVGIHPHDANACNESDLKQLENLAKHPKVVAWGETGLDYNRMYAPRVIQEKCLQRQIEIAQKLNLPMVFHERDSQGRFLALLNEASDTGLRGVVHCFSGNQTELTAYLDMGLHIGITGIVTQSSRGKYLRSLIPHIPDDRLLIETDAPYLTPVPANKKTRRNEPAFVKWILLKIAEIKAIDPEKIAVQIRHNTCRLFNLDA